MRIGIPKEILDGERRVAATPDTVKKLIKMGSEERPTPLLLLLGG